MLFARGEKAVEGEGIFAHVGVDEQGDFGVQFAEGGERGERDLHEVADAAYIDEDLIRALVGETSAKLANHRRRVFSSAVGVSTRGSARRVRMSREYVQLAPF